jgi:DNA repair photolyase
MRRVDNPPNPWLSRDVEWLGEPPPVELEVYEEEARSIVSENDSPDVPFDHSVNPYRGCQHACAYCYARPSHQYLGLGAGTDFDSKLVVKRNAPELLARELARRRRPIPWLAFSGVTDCYQPLEAGYRLTRRCLEVCLERRQSVGIVTKSALVRRDAPLLAELSRRASVRVFLSIPFFDPDLSRAIEPWAPTPATRLATLRALAEAGVEVGVACAPLILGLNDAQVPMILRAAREVGARHAFYVPLRLAREVRAVFEARLRRHSEPLARKVLSAHEESRAGQARPLAFGERMRGSGPRWRAAVDLFHLECRRLGLDTQVESMQRPAAALQPHVPERRRAPRQGELFGPGAAAAPRTDREPA